MSTFNNPYDLKLSEEIDEQTLNQKLLKIIKKSFNINCGAYEAEIDGIKHYIIDDDKDFELFICYRKFIVNPINDTEVLLILSIVDLNQRLTSFDPKSILLTEIEKFAYNNKYKIVSIETTLTNNSKYILGMRNYYVDLTSIKENYYFTLRFNKFIK